MKKKYLEPVILALLVVIATVTVAAVKHTPVKKSDSVYTTESADSDE